jgi:hypothetical protein
MIPFLRTGHILASRAHPQRERLNDVQCNNFTKDRIDQAVSLQYFGRVQQVGV